MPTPFTPSAQLAASDPALPDGPPSNAAHDRDLLNARRYLRGSVWGALVWNGRLRVSGSSNTTFAVVVGIIEAMTLCDGDGVWRPYFTSVETTLDLTHVEGAPANLANSTWYYVYAWADSAAPNSPKFQVSTSPPTEVGTPTVLRHWKRGQTQNYRYLGCFRTNGSGVPVACTASHGHYTWLDERAISVPAVGDTAGTAFAIDYVAPPHVSSVRAYATFSTSGGAVMSILSPGASTGVGSGGTTFTREFLPNASGLIYASTLSGGSASASFITQSFKE